LHGPKYKIVEGLGEREDCPPADQAEHGGGQVRIQHGPQLGGNWGQIHAQALQGLPIPSGSSNTNLKLNHSTDCPLYKSVVEVFFEILMTCDCHSSN
jgi:hypothetical protein